METHLTKAELAKLVWTSMNSLVSAEYPNGCGFSDVQGGQWYTFYICNLKAQGFFSTTNISVDGSFGVNSSVNRAYAAKLFMHAFDKVKDPNGLMVFSGDWCKTLAPYADVDCKAWYFSYLSRAAKLGITDVKGFVGAKFYPDTNLTKGRAQYWADNLKKALNK